MKKLEELMISPAPWKICDSGKNNGCIVDAEGAVCASGAATGCPPANASLIAEAPNLYRHLYSAAVEYCHKCDKCADGECQAEPGACFVQEWRKTLDLAAGVMK